MTDTFAEPPSAVELKFFCDAVRKGALKSEHSGHPGMHLHGII